MPEREAVLRARRADGIRRRGALPLLVALLAAAWAFVGRGEAEPALRLGDERACVWLASHAADGASLAGKDDRAFAAIALAARVLADLGGAPGASPAAELRAGLRKLQRADGAFGAGKSSEPLTWLALGAFEPSSSAADVECAGRARTWLRTAAGDAKSPTPQSNEAVSRAVGFLRRARVDGALDLDPQTTRLFTLAGGRFDLREAYASALEPEGEGARRIAPAAEQLDNTLYEVAVKVAVLDHYRTSKEAALLAEASRPAEEFLGLIEERRVGATGAWSASSGGAADVLSTACAIAVLDTLGRWRADLDRSALSDAEGRVDGKRTVGADCTACHERLQPAQVADWRKSRHARVEVGCVECHGSNHSTIFRESGRVPMAKCGECHVDAVKQFEGSKHAHAEETLVASALYAATPTALRASCHACHDIGRRQPDGPSGSCNHCHMSHSFDAADARKPEACTLCHTGADYPQDDAYRLSKHGALYRSNGDAQRAPTCVTCHQPNGRHDDGFGITIGGSGIGASVDGELAPFDGARLSAADVAARRAEMVAVCAQCHSSRLAEASLRKADELKREGDAHLLEALEILKGLERDGYFGAGAKLELGPQHARPLAGAAGVELLTQFYEMWRFHHATAWKGAYHQSASISNQSSGVGTQEDLQHIRAAAERWRAQGGRR